jgi:hypothetical protein
LDSSKQKILLYIKNEKIGSDREEFNKKILYFSKNNKHSIKKPANHAEFAGF